MAELHLWIKALHLIAMVAWMAGMLYLPRLYVYHADVEPGSPQSETFKVMERRLLRAIVNPAMIATWVFGGLMLWNLSPGIWSQGWIWVKLAMLFGLGAMHGLFSRWRREFEQDKRLRPAKVYRIANEVPTVMLIVIVIMAVVRPF
jgi:protoporphyrinogen IX oxidase